MLRSGLLMENKILADFIRPLSFRMFSTLLGLPLPPRS
jgi:hypothetical protein